MRKRRTWLLLGLGVLLMGLTVACVYEIETHVGRGWLRGEAFYDGRPTSYWQAHCDEWLGRFDTPNDAVPWAQSYLGFKIRHPGRNNGEVIFTNVPEDNWTKEKKWPRPQTTWHPLRELLFGRTDDPYAPRVLWGLPNAVPVLKELERQERYSRFARNALQRAGRYRERKQELTEAGWEIIREDHGFPPSKR